MKEENIIIYESFLNLVKYYHWEKLIRYRGKFEIKFPVNIKEALIATLTISDKVFTLHIGIDLLEKILKKTIGQETLLAETIKENFKITDIVISPIIKEQIILHSDTLIKFSIETSKTRVAVGNKIDFYNTPVPLGSWDAPIPKILFVAWDNIEYEFAGVVTENPSLLIEKKTIEERLKEYTIYWLEENKEGQNESKQE